MWVRLLLTNDDGIQSIGLHVLATHLADAGHEVVVVAPNADWSGAAASLGRLDPREKVDVERVEIPGAPAIEAWALAGPPALTVLSTRLGAFGAEPDLVVSGINAGLNTGRAVLHSGTVGAALTAQNFGWSGLAISSQWSDPFHWETAARFAVEVLDLFVDAPARSVLNLNVPARPYDEVLGLRWARLAPFGEVQAAMDGAASGGLQFDLCPTDEPFDPDTDSGTVLEGYAAITALVGVVEAWPADAGLDEVAEGGEVDVSAVMRPGAPLHAVHRLPDITDEISLRGVPLA